MSTTASTAKVRKTAPPAASLASARPIPEQRLAGPRQELPSSALYVQVAERLRSKIVSHELAPGSWIDEQSIASELGISRTPLREALKVLASEGLVTMKLRRGAYVTQTSARDLAEVFHLLAVLEADAAAAVAECATPADLEALQTLHDELEAALTDRDRFFAANERFHLQILAVADNRWRNQLVVDLRKVMKLNRHHSLFKQGRIEASLEEHRALMSALLARDAQRAQKAMREHLARGLEAAAD
jgi:DNA-binding GntR family transcriptional regulator